MAVKKTNQNGTKQQQGRTATDTLFDNLNTGGMLNNAQKVINSAVNVLEEEIAAGILAAKRIEQKMINVNEVRDDSQNLMNRIRKDTHEALDIFLDALAALSKQVGLLTDSVSKETTNKSHAATTAKEAVSSIQIIGHDRPVHAGGQANFSFVLSDDDLLQPLQLDFQTADFTGPGNQKVGSKYISIDPSSVTLNPKQEKVIAVTVKLPKICMPGNYNSILTITQMPAVKIILSFDIQ